MTLQKIINTIAYCKEIIITEYQNYKETLLFHCERDNLYSIRIKNTTQYEIVSIGSQDDVLTIVVVKE